MNSSTISTKFMPSPIVEDQRYFFPVPYMAIGTPAKEISSRIRTEVWCNDPRKSASHICAITPKGLVNLKLFQESIIKSSFT
jgi:hypothetical protein